MPKHPQIMILGYPEAVMFLRGRGSGHVQALVTIYGSQEFPIDERPIAQTLPLNFDDLCEPDPQDQVAVLQHHIRRKQAASIGRNLVTPCADHVKSIIDFADATRDIEGTVLCNCFAGISRSPAAALLLLAAWTGPGHESYCVREVKSVRRAAMPLHGIVKMGDELLDRNGNLIEALLADQR